jgi:flagellar basal-body rod protein FlgC
MDSLLSIEIAASGLDAQRMRMTAIASNLANLHSTRTAGGGGPYQRRDVLFRALPTTSFSELLSQKTSPNEEEEARLKVLRLMRGVQATSVIDRDTPPRLSHEPGHPDADENGNVRYPDISVVKEMSDMIAAQHSYEANLALVRSTIAMIQQAMRISM